MSNIYCPRRRFTLIHHINFVAVVLQFVTGTNQKSDRRKDWYGTYLGVIPGLHTYILNRAMMSPTDFRAYLRENYEWWWQSYYKDEDKSFFNFFTKDLMEEIIQLQEEWANPAIDLETTLAKIISFFTKHLACDYPLQTLLILMNILSSKCFCFSRKTISKNWRRKWERNQIDLFSKDNIGTRMRIQSFLFREIVNFLILNPSLIESIRNFRENEERLFVSIYDGFKMLTNLFLTNNVPFQQQAQICISSSNLVYRFEKNNQLWYQMIRKNFHSIQDMDKKFRVDLIKRSHFLLILIWRMFNQSRYNKCRKIPVFMSVKIMLTRLHFKKLFKVDPFIEQFLSMKS